MSTTTTTRRRVASMTPYQFGVVLLCMFVNMLDGYDVFVMGYALPHLPAGYATAAQKGYLISAALVGLGVGAIFLARLADTRGRRPALIGALAVSTVSLAASALAPNYAVLIASRFVTGMCVGVLGVAVMVIGQEMSPPSWRSLSIGIVMFGYPLGTFLAGLTGATVVESAGWKGLFWVGTGLSAAALLACVAVIPETVPFLRRSRDEKSQRKAQALAARIDLGEPAAAPATPAGHTRVRLLGREFRRPTLLLWAGYAYLTAGYYFVGTWTPQLIKDATGDAGSGAVVGIMLAVGTMAGALLYGYLGMRRPSAQISWVAMGVAMIALAGFAVTLQGVLALTMAALLGLCVFGAMSAYAALANSIYPVDGRANGFGAMLGTGRVGAIVSPILGGYAVGFLEPRQLYLAVLVPLALAGVCSLALGRAVRPKTVPAPATV